MVFSDIKHMFGNIAKSLTKKTDLKSLLGDLSGILDAQDSEVFVVRGKGCEVLFANTKAEGRLYTEEGYAAKCKVSFAKHFPGLCANCPYGGVEKEKGIKVFEIEDTSKSTYSAKCNVINWIDGKPAAIFMLRDITSELELKERLFALAYIDQLTGVPNRQRLKDDFTALEEKIARDELKGVVALFDIDNFKAVNDTYGHNMGDLVLSRLAGYLENDRNFAGHLYRLGGDEFVLLYTDAPDRFNTDDDLTSHYNQLLSNVLRDYTLPNIELKCTLSIGVTIFPKHGVTLSEILRKADIAMYQAKESGRNQVVFFEARYDSAQKFKDMYINIQPVLLSTGKTFGYELIDSGEGQDEDEQTVPLREFNRTLDALGLNDIESKFHYFISYSKQLLNPAVLKNLPKDKFIVQVHLPDIDLQEDINTFVELRNNGYKLALTGFGRDTYTQDLLEIASYIKFSEGDSNLSAQKRIIALNQKIRFIAANVDSTADFQKAKETGFNLFQGYYFSQPAVGQKTKELSPLKINYFRLLKLSSTNDYMDFREISQIVSADVALSYKLLRILNSAAVGLRNVSSISNAVTYMGEESLKKWIAVLALRGIAEDKPLELVRLSLIRARFGELLAPCFRIKRNPQQVFMVGMLSLLHIALEMSKEQLLDEIPVAFDIRESLLTKTGIYSDILSFFENYEYANWEGVSMYVAENQLDSSYVNDAYITSVKWYNDLVK
ncbi:MAG: diguanylate cyclase [Oscillospiraceae bacterium]|nr:diguanylate cyclase [Oscillospiraceae bacterium]